MNLDIAVRFAATETELTTEQVTQLLDRFLSTLARCHVCDGTAVFEYKVDTPIIRKVDEAFRWSHVPAGTASQCPRCGPPDQATERSVGDRSWVRWICDREGYDMACRPPTETGHEPAKGHEECSYRVVLPIDIATVIHRAMAHG
jgi:hypothetical protein